MRVGRWVLGCLGILLAGPVAAQVVLDYEPELRFSMFQSCSPGRTTCEPWLMAKGEIDPQASVRLLEILKAHPIRGIAFDSPGGDLMGGLALGRTLRVQGLKSWLAKTYIDDQGRPLTQRAVCLSACSYAFLGGVRRLVEADAFFGIHSFSPPPGHVPRISLEWEERVLEKMLLGYVASMKADPRMVFAAQMVPSEDIRRVSPAEAREWKISE